MADFEKLKQHYNNIVDGRESEYINNKKAQDIQKKIAKEKYNLEKPINERENTKLFEEIGLLELLQKIIDKELAVWSDEPIYEDIKFLGLTTIFQRKIKDFHPAFFNYCHDVSSAIFEETHLNFNCQLEFISNRNRQEVRMEYYQDHRLMSVVLNKDNLEEQIAIGLANTCPTVDIPGSDYSW